MRDLLAQREQAERNVYIYILSTLDELGNFKLFFDFWLILLDLLLFAEISRDSGCGCQKVVKWKRRELASITFNFAICRFYFSACISESWLHFVYYLKSQVQVVLLIFLHWQILGPDSGWQPVPLTEVITAAAVKRAYRKATLCVHPDKLQQRGASIHQKYICEKVFDLLKVC